jgi:hypothetical protein
VEHLGAYVAAALSPRDLAKVDQHLAACLACRERHAELEELGEGLRRIVVPLPIGLGAVALKHWRAAAHLSPLGRARGLASGLTGGKVERPLAVISASIFAVGLAGLGIVGPKGDGPSTVASAPPPAAVPFTHVDEVHPSTPSLGYPAVNCNCLIVGNHEDLSRERRLASFAPTGADDSAANTPTPTPADQTSGNDTLPPSPAPPPPPPPPTPDPAPKPTAQVHVTVSGGAASASVAAGQGDGSCTGGSLNGQSAGCAPAPPNSDALITATTGGQALPAQDVHLP